MGAVRTRYLAPTIPICTMHWTLTYLGTSMYIGPHTCMSRYVSAYHGVGKLCILLHTILCHAVRSVKNCYHLGLVGDSPVPSRTRKSWVHSFHCNNPNEFLKTVNYYKTASCLLHYCHISTLPLEVYLSECDGMEVIYTQLVCIQSYFRRSH